MKLGAKISGECQGRPLAAGWEGLPKGGEGAGRGPEWSRATSSAGAQISLMQAEIFCHKGTQRKARIFNHGLRGWHGFFGNAEGGKFLTADKRMGLTAKHKEEP
jgi:hypothetical protein